MEDESREELVKLAPEAHSKEWREEEGNQPHNYFPLRLRRETVFLLVSMGWTFSLLAFVVLFLLFFLCLVASVAGKHATVKI